MPVQSHEKENSRVTQRVSDSVPKINNELAVGEDLPFQRRWWKFERCVWIFFGLILALDVSGLLGRGPLAHARATAEDGSIEVVYERIERFATPAMLRVTFKGDALQDGKLRLWASESLVGHLGNQRISPQPESSELNHGGLLYTFPAKQIPAIVDFALQPAVAGSHMLKMQVPGRSELTLKIFVMP